MQREDDPAAKPGGTKERKPKRIYTVGAVFLALPILIWVVAAYFVARSIKYPAFLYSGNGQDVFGTNVPNFKRGSITEITAAVGMEPERFDAGTVEDDAGRHRQVSVVGWYFPGKRREVVVIVPAAGGSEVQLIPYIKFLHEAGYTVVANYSANNPRFGISWGMLKCKFALATARALNVLGFEKIAALGISEGAAGAIMAQARQPVFTAIVADSSYANLRQLILRSPSISRLNPAFASTVLWEAQWWFGRPLSKISPANDAANLGNIPLLVIQNRGDKITPPEDGKAILYAGGVNSEIWIAPSDGHGDAIYEVPTMYADRVIKFLNASFGIEAPAAAPTVTEKKPPAVQERQSRKEKVRRPVAKRPASSAAENDSSREP
jgi:pimeloyl-ACP methyl ester carboxylesterase